MTETPVTLQPGGDARRSMSGGQAVAEMLKAHQIGPIFGMAGFQLLPFYEAVRALGLRHILVNDERCGALAADAYARVTGRPGVCDASLGPGTTNLITGLVESLNAGVPLVVIIGDTHREYSWKNMTQECRQLDIVRPAVKELIRVELGHRIPELVRRAFAVATSGRPGPVVIDIPEDISHGIHEFRASDFHAEPATFSYPARRARPARDDIGRAAALLSRAKRPLILAGGGVHLSGAYEALGRFAAAQGIPVAHTISGKGSIACSDPLSAGVFGRYSRIANDLLGTADCVISVGCKLGEIATRRYALLPPGVPLIHLDNVAEEFAHTTMPEVALWGDARDGLDDLYEATRDDAPRLKAERRDYAAEIPRRMAEWRRGAADRTNSTDRPIHVARLLEAVNRTLPADGIFVADGGFAAHWSALFFETKAAGRGFVAHRGFASIGCGVPATLGSQIGAGDRPVVGITGDGGLNMVIGELETACRAKAPFTLITINNAASGYVKALQHALFGKYQSSDLSELDYSAIARGFGCHGIRVEDPADLEGALTQALANRDKPTLVDVVTTRDPAQMLPAVDSRTVKIVKGDRPA